MLSVCVDEVELELSVEEWDLDGDLAIQNKPCAKARTRRLSVD